ISPVVAGTLSVIPWLQVWCASLGTIAGRVAVPTRWGKRTRSLTVNPYYVELASTPQRRQALWREFLMGEDPKEAQVQRGDWTTGEEPFRLRLEQRGGRPVPRRRGRPPRPG